MTTDPTPSSIVDELAAEPVGLGCNNFGWRLGAAESDRVLATALDAGVRVLDTADTYGDTASESAVGRAIARRRSQALIVTKFGLGVSGAPDLPRGSGRYARWAVEGSLRRLRTDYLDVYLYHRYDGITPWAETLGAMADLHQAGKIRAAGVSGVTAEELRGVHRLCAELNLPLAVVENRYSLVHRDVEGALLPACVELGVGLVPFYPLESGLLTGQYRRGQQPAEDSRFATNPGLWPADRWLTGQTFDRIEALEGLAAEWGVSLLEVAIGALVARTGVGPVICGARTPDHVLANVAAGNWRPSPEQLQQLFSPAGVGA